MDQSRVGDRGKSEESERGKGRMNNTCEKAEAESGQKSKVK